MPSPADVINKIGEADSVLGLSNDNDHKSNAAAQLLAAIMTDLALKNPVNFFSYSWPALAADVSALTAAQKVFYDDKISYPKGTKERRYALISDYATIYADYALISSIIFKSIQYLLMATGDFPQAEAFEKASNFSEYFGTAFTAVGLVSNPNGIVSLANKLLGSIYDLTQGGESDHPTGLVAQPSLRKSYRGWTPPHPSDVKPLAARTLSAPVLDGPKRRTPPVPPAQVKAPNGLVLQGTSPAPLAATPKITHAPASDGTKKTSPAPLAAAPKITHAPASNGTRRHAPAVPPTEVKAPNGITVPGSLSSPVASTDSANNNDLNKTHRETVITRKGDKVLIQGYIEEGGNLKLVRTREISADQYDHPEKYTSGKPTPSPRHGGHVKDAQAHLYIESDGPLVGAKPPEAVTAPPKKPDQHSDATGGTPPSPAHITPSAWHPHQQALQNHAILASYNPSQPARSGGRSAGGAAGDRVRPWSGGAPGDVIVPSEGGTPTPRDRFLPPNDEASGVKAADLHRLVDRLDKLTAELRRSQDRPIAVDVHLDGKQISRAVTHHLNRSLASPGISNNLDHRAVGFPPGSRASSV